MHPCVRNNSLPINLDLECLGVSQSFVVHPQGETQAQIGSNFFLYLLYHTPVDSGAVIVTLVFSHVEVNTTSGVLYVEGSKCSGSYALSTDLN